LKGGVGYATFRPQLRDHDLGQRVRPHRGRRLRRADRAQRFAYAGRELLLRRRWPCHGRRSDRATVREAQRDRARAGDHVPLTGPADARARCHSHAAGCAALLRRSRRGGVGLDGAARGEHRPRGPPVRAGRLAVPRFPWRAGRLGFALLRAGDPREAAQRFKRAVQSDSSDADAWYGLGLAWARLGERSPAVAAWRRVLGIAPHYADAETSCWRLVRTRRWVCRRCSARLSRRFRRARRGTTSRADRGGMGASLRQGHQPWRGRCRESFRPSSRATKRPSPPGCA